MSSTVPSARGSSSAAESNGFSNVPTFFPSNNNRSSTTSKNTNDCDNKDDRDAYVTGDITTSDVTHVFRPRSSSLPNTHRTDTLSYRGEEGQSNDHYMSEPSLSEDGTGASSSHYTHPLSPINRAIHMTHSHSNTSLSSLGSPSHANARISRKKIHFFGDKSLGPKNKNSLLSPIEGYSEGDSIGEEPDLNMIPDQCKLCTEDFKKQEGEKNIDAAQDPKSKELLKECTWAHNDTGDNGDISQTMLFVKNDTKVPFFKLSGDGMTPDSQRYLTAVESSDDEDDDNDDHDDDDDDDDDDEQGSSDLSYDSSSQESEGKRNSHQDPLLPLSNVKETEESCHFLNKPSTKAETPNKTNGDSDSKKEDEDVLLRNTDSRSMDLSLILEGESPYSPDDSLLAAETPSSNFIITTPPRITPFDFPEAEESITPKMKTSRPSSISGSPSSNSDGGRKRLIKSASHPTPLETCEKDEKMYKRNRVNSGDKRHRRTRSGDDAAAMISTGSSDWVGMEMHNIPLPSERDADDDEDETAGSHDQVIKDSIDFGKQRRRGRNSQVGLGNIPNNDLNLYKEGTIEDGISTRFSPRIAADLKFEVADHFGGSPLHRSHSFGEASVSTADSSFSWISRGTSFIFKEPDHQKNSNPSDHVVHERDFLTSGRTNYKSLSSIPQSLDKKIIPMGTPDLSAHVIPDFDKDLEIQDEQGKHSIPSKTKSMTESSKFSFDPSQSQAELEKNYPTFRCPKCNTLQREFFTVSSARTRFESPSQYIAIYFFIYMLMSLFIFGMEEGWPPLDCVYFSVITLTTTGLGDYVPNNNAAKIICSIFIYFGVSCIGLLLGSMHASSLDDAAKKQAKENRISSCVNCARKQGYPAPHTSTYWFGKQSSLRNSMRNFKRSSIKTASSANETTSLLSLERTTYPTTSSSWYNPRGTISRLNTIDETKHHGNLGWKSGKSPDTSSYQAPAAPIETMQRQSNTRQYPVESPAMTNIFDPAYKSSNRRRIETDTTVNASNTNNLASETSTAPLSRSGTGPHFHVFDDSISDIDNTDNTSQCSGWSTFSHPAEADTDILSPVSKIKAAKYVFLTLKQAFTNSLFVILIGSVGFYFIEKHMTVVDAFYFTTVLLTTVGYGDIVPKTPEGKLFCTVYSLVAGAVLLHQMSMISMIPLELRRRRIERSVLLQFGDELDDAALEELTTGPLMRRIQLSGNNPEGLGQCSRETFALAMLVRLGRITEQDIRSTYAAFNRLDKDNDGLLTSREISASTFDRRRREQKNTMQEAGAFLPNQQLKTYEQQQQRDDSISEPGRERGMSIESNYSAITYEDVDDANTRWSNNKML